MAERNEDSAGNDNKDNYTNFYQFLTQLNGAGSLWPQQQSVNQHTNQQQWCFGNSVQQGTVNPFLVQPTFGTNNSHHHIVPCNDRLVLESTLLPTATEFVPRSHAVQDNSQISSESTNSSLNGLINGVSESLSNCSITSDTSKGAIKKTKSGEHRNDTNRKTRDNRNFTRDRNIYSGNRNDNLPPRFNQHFREDRVESSSRKIRPNKSIARNGHWRSKELQEDEIKDKFNSPKNRNNRSTDQTESQLVKSQREILTDKINANKLECLVCIEIIKPFLSIWCCQNCYLILHLNCLSKWVKKSSTEDGWRCPACQTNSKHVPNEYYCFCKKKKNPIFNRNELAHSCGEVCGRKINCSHPCTLLCHPGPCPPCQATVERKCGCERTSRIMQCSQKFSVVCDAKCSKLLSCHLHECQDKCHIGDCSNCIERIEHNCYCGKETKTVNCTIDNAEFKQFSCNQCCDRPLDCLNHQCKRICHANECGECQLLPINTLNCPCGKTKLEEGKRTSCTDPIPTCQNVCGKQLKCGPESKRHFCTSKCHLGDCPPCNKETPVKCRCGYMSQMIRCRQLETKAENVRCKKRCIKKRNCGKHKCNVDCCVDINHFCPLPCAFTLSCGKHKCDQTCHKGRCHSCPRTSFDELRCECGTNVIYPPVPCGTKRPPCSEPCSRQHSCSHQVQHTCHTANTCPPCMTFTTQFCYGKHEQRKTIPCSQDSFSCGMPCNQPLECKQHKCLKPCHTGPCQLEGEKCKQNCTNVRQLCPHNCNAPCHTGDCPDVPCKENVEVVCACGHRKQIRPCHDFSREYRRITIVQMAKQNEAFQQGSDLNEILGPVKLTNNKTLECNDDCRLAERNRRLAIGLQIRNPDLPSKLQPKYSEFIRGWAKKDPQLVGHIHDKLTELVKLAKESAQKSRSHSFPVMNREKRQLVHEMCEMFGVKSVAYDAEPNRNVVATAVKETSWLPSVAILDLLKRENGVRRVPLPSMNSMNGVKR